MKTIKINKLNRVEAPEDMKKEGIEAFQIVEFTINWFGSMTECCHDTRIMKDGGQFVIGGDGFIKDGFEVIG